MYSLFNLTYYLVHNIYWNLILSICLTLDFYCDQFFVSLYLQLTRAYFAFLEVLFSSHIVFILNLDTNTFMHIAGSLESGLKGLDTNISSQVWLCIAFLLTILLFFINQLTCQFYSEVCEWFLSWEIWRMFFLLYVTWGLLIFVILLQCASAVDNLAAFYFNNITMGETPSSPAANNLARHIVDCPTLFPEVRNYLVITWINFQLSIAECTYLFKSSGLSCFWFL